MASSGGERRAHLVQPALGRLPFWWVVEVVGSRRRKGAHGARCVAASCLLSERCFVAASCPRQCDRSMGTSMEQQLSAAQHLKPCAWLVTQNKFAVSRMFQEKTTSWTNAGSTGNRESLCSSGYALLPGNAHER